MGRQCDRNGSDLGIISIIVAILNATGRFNMKQNTEETKTKRAWMR
jgi:hypothetical protein